MIQLEDTRLWQTQENISDSLGNVRIDAVYGDDSEDALLTGLESIENVEYTGIATGNRLALQDDRPDDPLQALAEWVVEAETYVNGQQGTGWSLQDDERGDTRNVVLRNFGWQRNRAEKYQVSWDMAALWGRGMMEPNDTTPQPVTPSQSWSLDGHDLQYVDSYRQQKQQEVTPYPIAYADAGDNEVLAKGGATRRIMIVGSVESNRNSFDSTMQSLIGQDNIVTFSEGFPGRDLDVMVQKYESTREAGWTRFGDYMLELVEGVA